MFESVDDRALLYFKLTLWAFGSGELKMKARDERNAHLTVWDVTKIDLQQSDYHYTDRDKLYDAPNQWYSDKQAWTKCRPRSGAVWSGSALFAILLASFVQDILR